MMEQTLLNGITTGVVSSGEGIQGSQKKPEDSFMEEMIQAMDEVNQFQKKADQAVLDLTTGKRPDIHQTMIALEKAEVSFQLMMQVRNKIISAYEEIMRMQV